MKKSHMILLALTILMTVFSSYSLAAINRVYKINFGWYSQYEKKFMTSYRDSLKDKWALDSYPESMKFGIITSPADSQFKEISKILGKELTAKVDFSRYLLIYCSIGKVFSPEYRIRVLDIAQRGNVVEIRFDINSPHKKNASTYGKLHEYYPIDLIKIERSAFSEKGDLVFIFKDQNGKQFYQQQCYLY